MHLHALVKIDAIAFKCYFIRMTRRPEDTTIKAWARLVRAEQAIMSKIEGELKEAGLPPLAWYDVLLELSREPRRSLRPVELERRLLLAQYNASRLIDRLEKAGLVERQACPEDARGQFVALTQKGEEMQKQMWRTYGPAIERNVGGKLTAMETETLASLLGKLLEEDE